MQKASEITDSGSPTKLKNSLSWVPILPDIFILSNFTAVKYVQLSHTLSFLTNNTQGLCEMVLISTFQFQRHHLYYSFGFQQVQKIDSCL